MEHKISKLLGLISIVIISSYTIIFPLNTYAGKILGLLGIMVYFVFTLSWIVSLPTLEENCS